VNVEGRGKRKSEVGLPAGGQDRRTQGVENARGITIAVTGKRAGGQSAGDGGVRKGEGSHRKQGESVCEFEGQNLGGSSPENVTKLDARRFWYYSAAELLRDERGRSYRKNGKGGEKSLSVRARVFPGPDREVANLTVYKI